VILNANWLCRLSSLFCGALGAFVLLGLFGLPEESRAQQKIGYVDNQYVLKNLPEYATVQQKLDKLEQEWRTEIQKREQNVQDLREEYNAWKLLYTEEERKKKKTAIEQAQKKVEQLRKKYFGPEGRLYTRQKKLMRPIQERILKATRTVAKARGYDYVLDKGGKVLFMYAREEHDLSDPVLRELGINPQKEANRR
jgi:outer membrane protein